jgi:selenocysteine-specific elongation factor
MDRHIVIGTAGHIDHGKSALVKSLTGTDPDRLIEEKERGMTTDLGFAFYGDNVTIIDVPGHEKFVRHMLAGASTIDFVLFVIAADDGVMPQTVEHLEILKLLDLKKGFIVLTKKDLVKDDWLEMVTADIRKFMQGTFLENAPILPVSNVTGEGIDQLKEKLAELINQIETKPDLGIFRMPIDRHFIIKGFGTVVAGTILSGKIKIGDTLEILPQKTKVKIRGIEVHNKKVEEATVGYRAAINLAGIEKEEVERGYVLAQIGYFEPSSFLNASLYLLQSCVKPMKTFTRVRVHLGTSEIFGRAVLLDKKLLRPGEKGMVQFRLETPAVSNIGDRFVIRTYSPPNTIGGGTIIDPRAAKVTAYDEQLIEHLQRIETGNPEKRVEENLNENFDLPRKVDEIAYDLNILASEVPGLLKKLVAQGTVVCLDEKRGLYYTQANLDLLSQKITDALKAFHLANPARTGPLRLELATQTSRNLDHLLFNYALDRLTKNNRIQIHNDDRIGLAEFKVRIDSPLNEMLKKLERIFLNSGYKPPDYNELLTMRLGPEEMVKKAHRYMLDTGVLIYIGEAISMHRDLVAPAREKLIGFLRKKPEIRVAEFRDLLDGSRKYVLPLLIYFDTQGVTIKRGEVRVLAEKYRSS